MAKKKAAPKKKAAAASKWTIGEDGIAVRKAKVNGEGRWLCQADFEMVRGGTGQKVRDRLRFVVSSEDDNNAREGGRAALAATVDTANLDGATFLVRPLTDKESAKYDEDQTLPNY